MSGVSAEEFSKFKEDFTAVKQDLTSQVGKIIQRLDKLGEDWPRRGAGDEELFEAGSRSRSHLPDHTYASLPHGVSNTLVTPSPGSSRAIPAAEDVQAEYRSIAESVNKVQLPSDCTLNKSAIGINRELKTAHTVITQASKYTETSLKLLINYIANPPAGEEELSKLFTIQYAQLRYLQDELAGLIVQGQFDQGTSKLFRSLQKNTSAFTPEALENLRSAAAISATQVQTNRGAGHNRRGRFRGNSGGHGSYRGNSGSFIGIY